MFLRKLLSAACMCSIVLLYSTVYAQQTPQEFLEEHEDAIEKYCDGDTECQLAELYALHKVINLLLTVDVMSIDREILMELMDEFEIKEFDTFDFKGIDIGFKDYLNTKERKKT